MFHGHYLGLYEKALEDNLSWKERLKAAKELGFDYMEISIDETDKRIQRLYWNKEEMKKLADTVYETGIPIRTMCLSAHRKYPFGSHDALTRQKAYEIMEKAIAFADFLNIKVIQLAGYDVYYEKSSDESVKAFEDGMRWAAGLAETHQIMLGMEIMDTNFMNSISRHLELEHKINSPYYKVYPDIGNLTAWGNDIASELYKGIGSIVSIHLKETKPVSDTSPGKFRGVPFGSGTVDFAEFFRLIRKYEYKGPFLIEMWSGTTDDDLKEIKRTIEFLENAYGE